MALTCFPELMTFMQLLLFLKKKARKDVTAATAATRSAATSVMVSSARRAAKVTSAPTNVRRAFAVPGVRVPIAPSSVMAPFAPQGAQGMGAAPVAKVKTVPITKCCQPVTAKNTVTVLGKGLSKMAMCLCMTIVPRATAVSERVKSACSVQKPPSRKHQPPLP